MKVNKKIRKGRFGVYSEIGDGQGRKVFFDLGRTVEHFWDIHLSHPENMVSAWNKVYEEAALLELAQSSKVSPKIFKVEIIRKEGKIYPAIVMEHFDGIHPKTKEFFLYSVKRGIAQKDKIYNPYEYRSELSDYLQKHLQQRNIYHSDLHCKNIIILANGQVRAIDFSSDFASFYLKHTEKFELVAKKWKKEFENLVSQELEQYKNKMKTQSLFRYYQRDVNDAIAVLKKTFYIGHWDIKNNKVEMKISTSGDYARKKAEIAARKMSKILKKPVQANFSKESIPYTILTFEY